MEDVAGTEFLKSLLDALAVAHVAHEQFDIGIGKVLPHLEGNVVHGGLGLVKQDDLAGAIGGHLTNNLTANAAG